MKTKTTWLAVRLERITTTSHSMLRTSACTVTVALLLAAIPARADHRVVDGGSPGPFPVGHTSFVSTNESGRPVAIDVYYPADARRITRRSAEAVYVMDPYTFEVPSTTSSQWEALGYDRAYESPATADGRFPLVMFSTGFWTPGYSYLYFGTRLASHGYIVAVVEHFNETTWLASGWDGMPTVVYNRPRDLSFALTELLARNRTPGDLLQHTIDRRYIVAAGHSLGGYAAFTELAGDDQVCDSTVIHLFGDEVPDAVCQPTPTDPRFNALLTLDGSSQVLRWEELSRIRVPSLIMGDAANADGDYLETDGPSYQSFVARPHAAISARTRSLRVDLDDAEHGSFNNAHDGIIVLFNAGVLSPEAYELYMSWYPEPLYPDREAHHRITKYAVAWLKAEVVKDGSELSERILTQKYTITHEPTVELWWNERCRCEGDNQPETFTYFVDMVGTCIVGDKNPADFFLPYPQSLLGRVAETSSQFIAPIEKQMMFKAMRPGLK